MLYPHICICICVHTHTSSAHPRPCVDPGRYLGASPPLPTSCLRRPTDGFGRPRARRCRARQSFLMRPQRVAVAASGVGAGAIARTGGEGAPRALELSSLLVTCHAQPLSRCLIPVVCCLPAFSLLSSCALPTCNFPCCVLWRLLGPTTLLYHHNSRQLDGMASV